MVDSGKVEELLQYKKNILRDDRRDSRIRNSIENTLEFLNRTQTKLVNPFNDSPIPEEPAAGSAQYGQRPMPHYHSNSTSSIPIPPYPGPWISAPLGLSGSNNMAGVNYDQKRDIENPFEPEKPKQDQAHGHDDHHHDVDPSTVDWRERLKHFTFAWYASTMSTGGVAFIMSVVPNRPDFVFTLGKGMYVFNIMLFLTITFFMCLRFYIHPGTLRHSLANVHEGFFFATFWLSIATMITNATAYGIPATGTLLIVPLRIAFWVYTVCAITLAVVYYHVLFMTKQLKINNVLPGWVLPVFPAMLVGTLASAIAKTQPPEHALPMLVAGLSFQGLGMILSLAMYGIYFGRLLTSGLPADMSRPAMFIAVGPPSFTALAFIGMAQDVTDAQIFTNYTQLPFIINQNLIYDFVNILAILSAIFLWMLAAWFFGIAVFAAIEAISRNDFHLNWYAYVFPNVGFTIATIQIGNRLNSAAIQGVGTGMAGVFFVLLLVIYFAHIKAYRNRMICWPGKDEDAH